MEKNAHRFQNISEEVAVLPQHLKQLQHLRLPLAMLVGRMRVHDVVQRSRGARAHRPRRSRVCRVGGVEVEELDEEGDDDDDDGNGDGDDGDDYPDYEAGDHLDEEGDAAGAAHHVAVGRAGGHRQEGARHLVNVGAAEKSHQRVRRLCPSVAAASATSSSPIVATPPLLTNTTRIRVRFNKYINSNTCGQMR